ncbi:structure-specific endonuclease subunit SLX4 isoform X1 [Harmonia axyridis]|uniref:structure-specific endonuclease subunit SLX4 isoform X1 n=2 Tax=Harmonia axyridis TaxID=115357 RepID=UPI001E2754FF|nr:structure-specific endonuclease subunit SLX4 isoform X1 [Harmonia axyridis]
MSKFKKTGAKTNDNLNISKDDFESPVVFKKFKPSNKIINTKRANNKKTKKQLTLHQVYQDNFKYSDVDSEQLQLALALSRSMSEIHNECSEKEEFPLASQNDGKKKTLLEFGFRTNKPKINVENKILRKEPLKTNKKSKFRFITPILMMRTEEDRKSLVQLKLSALIAQNPVDSCYIPKGPPEISSEELEKIRCIQCSIFFFDQKNTSSDKDLFLVPHLNIEGSRAKTGSLLKDWKKIPLRDHTPERSKIKKLHSVEISEIKTFENNESRVILHSNIMKLPKPEGKDELQNSFINSQLSVEYYESPVSPDLFDSYCSSSENKALSPSEKSLRNTKKDIENISTQTKTVYENKMESVIEENFLSDFNSFTNEGCKVHLEKTIEQESKSSYYNNVELSKNEYEEKKFDNGIDLKLKKRPEICLSVSSMSKNKIQNLEPQSKDRGELYENNDSFNVHTVVVSSDEEFSVLENSLVKAERSLKVVKNFNEDLDPLEKYDPDITKDSKMSNRILQNDLYCLDDKEDIDCPLNISDIVNNAKKKYSNEIVFSSDEERIECLSDSLKKLRKKYINSSFDTSLKIYNNYQSDALKERNLFERDTSNYSHHFDSNKDIEEKEINQRSLHCFPNLVNKCDNLADIISSSDEENFNRIIDEKFINNKFLEVKNDLQSINREKVSFEVTEKVGEQSEGDKEKTLNANTEDFEMPERILSPDSDNNIESDYIHFMDDKEMECPFNISKIVNNVKKKYLDEIISSSSKKTKIEHSSDSLKLKKFSEKYNNMSNCSFDVSLEKFNNAQFSSSGEHNLSEKPSSDSSSHLKLIEFDKEKEFSDGSSVCSPNYFNEGSKFVDSIILSSDGDNSNTEIDGEFIASDIKSLDILCNSQMDYSSEKSNIMKSELSPNLNQSDILSSRKYSSLDTKKPEELSDNFSESLLDHFFEGNFHNSKNNSSGSEEIYNSVESHIQTGECWNFKSAKVNNEHEDSDVKSKTPLRKYTSFIENSTPSKMTNFSKHKSESNITPNRKFVIKTTDITPMADYNAFSTPEIVQELGKFGLKPLKRKRGINLLEHIYETTHPKVKAHQTDVKTLPLVKRRRSDESQKIKNLDRENLKSEVLNRWSGSISESEAIFERQRSTKLPTCQVPLQIVWHNFLNENPKILENILLYEPLQIEVIHKMLKELGYKFHLQDLITFMDQKCITIRVAQTQHIKVK